MKYLSSADNAGLKRLARLQQQPGAYRDEGVLLCEGLHLWNEWRLHGQARFALSALYFSAANGIQLGGFDALAHEVPHALLSRYASGQSAQHLLFLLSPAVSALATTAAGAVDTVLLDAVQDAGNVGSILRSAAGVGARSVALGPGCALAYSPKVLRAGRGAHFVLDVTEPRAAAVQALLAHGHWCAAMLEDSTSLYETELAPSVNWIFGNEGQGVSAELASRATERVRIPQQGPQSLNVAAAAAVCLFETQRRALRGQVSI